VTVKLKTLDLQSTGREFNFRSVCYQMGWVTVCGRVNYIGV